jgi:hypothetical protein
MRKILFFLVMSFVMVLSNCTKENIKKEKVGSTSLVIYDQASVSFFSKQSLIPSCLDGVKKAGAKEVISINCGTADGMTGSTNSSRTSKSCSAVGVE